MNKNLLNNSWILAGLLFAISTIVRLIILAVVKFIGMGSATISNIAGLIGAMIVGQIYSMNFKEIMPKRLRINVTIVYIISEMILGISYVLWFGLTKLLLGLLVGLQLFIAIIIYFTLGFAGKNYIRSLKTR